MLVSPCEQRIRLGMEIRSLGDCAILVELADRSQVADLNTVLALAERIRAANRAGVREVVPGLNAVAIHLKEGTSWHEEARALEQLLADFPPPADRAKPTPSRTIEIPVIYGRGYGSDLAEVAKQSGLSEEAVVAQHVAGDYQVQAIGFAPGFPYLAGLDPVLHTPRRRTPRTTVPVGSVGIGGRQTGVYPLSMPGGWNLIGRTPLSLFNAENGEDSPSLLRAGDQVKFRQINEAEFNRILSEQLPLSMRPAYAPEGGVEVEVLAPGVQTTVQDARRSGFQRWGVAAGGAMNSRAARLANLLVGNPRDAAVLEWVVKGPKLFFTDARVLAVTGATVAGVPYARTFSIEGGEVLDLSRLIAGCRGVLAISGGVDVPLVLGSRSTHLAGGFGGFKGRALKKGDLLGLGETVRRTVKLGWFMSSTLLSPPGAEPGKVRFVRGPEWDWLDADTQARFTSESFEVGAQSNRMGLRLEGVTVQQNTDQKMISQPVTAGTVQVPRDGNPIVLMADHQSLGGYPRIANVIWVDLPILAEIRGGETFQFQEVSLAEAEDLRLQAEKDYGLLEMGIKRHF
jgi:KipI family sensor histidine kinase inhibitor